jgi:hypothetical protein
LLETLAVPNNSGFTDEGLQHLVKLTNLKMLHLRGENFTDAGLGHLASLRQLEIFFNPKKPCRSTLHHKVRQFWLYFVYVGVVLLLVALTSLL